MAPALALLLTTLATALADSQFASIDALLCIRSDFVENQPRVKSELDCSLLCYRRRRCQAFSMATGWCQLFVFDACSKYVRDCNCTRRAQVFVRQQPGLPPGALCPAGYTDDTCGTKYKFMSCLGNWNMCKGLCDAESGLVIMADVTDATEMAKVGQLIANKVTANLPCQYLGGWQLPGSVEPGGGWQWVSCGGNVSAALWKTGEPNNNPTTENRIAVDSVKLLIDIPETYGGCGGGLCECSSPFG